MSAAPDPARHPLIAHPASRAGAVRELAVTVRRSSRDVLDLAFSLTGDIPRLLLPEPRPPVRADGLWRHTCFEAFIHRSGAREYWEYNLAPSGAWAAYHFSGYREGMAPLLAGAAPAIALTAGSGTIELLARLDLGWLARTAPGAGLRLGLAAVIEDEAGALSYWALAHPAEKPDFHHADSFVVAAD